MASQFASHYRNHQKFLRYRQLQDLFYRQSSQRYGFCFIYERNRAFALLVQTLAKQAQSNPVFGMFVHALRLFEYDRAPLHGQTDWQAHAVLAANPRQTLYALLSESLLPPTKDPIQVGDAAFIRTMRDYYAKTDLSAWHQCFSEKLYCDRETDPPFANMGFFHKCFSLVADKDWREADQEWGKIEGEAVYRNGTLDGIVKKQWMPYFALNVMPADTEGKNPFFLRLPQRHMDAGHEYAGLVNGAALLSPLAGYRIHMGDVECFPIFSAEYAEKLLFSAILYYWPLYRNATNSILRHFCDLAAYNKTPLEPQITSGIAAAASAWFEAVQEDVKAAYGHNQGKIVMACNAARQPS